MFKLTASSFPQIKLRNFLKKGFLSERLSKDRFDPLLFQEVVNETILAGVILFHVHVSFLKYRSTGLPFERMLLKRGTGNGKSWETNKQCWTRVSGIVPSFNFVHCIGWGEGKLQENFEKDALTVFFFLTEPRNQRKI